MRQHNQEIMQTVRGSNFNEDLYRADTALMPYSPPLEMDDDAEGLLHGRLVSWFPTSHDVVQVPSHYIVATPMNIWDMEYMNYLYNLILDREGVFETPFGDASIIGLEDIAATNEALKDDLLREEFGIEEPWTTGKEEWDQIITGWYKDSKLEYLQSLEQDIADRYEEFEVYQEQEDLDKGLLEVDELLEEEIGVDRDGLDHVLIDIGLPWEGLTIPQKVQSFIQWIEEKQPGDLGQVEIALNDGNHRSMAAIAAGEPYIFVSIPKLDHYRKVDPELAEHLEAMLVD